VSGFGGAKLAILTGGHMLAILRDDKPDIPFPGLWDLPGGGREGGESPEDCALRETREELGLVLPASALVWRRRYPRWRGSGWSWFFAAEVPGFDPGAVVFGDEGQGWRLMPVAEFSAGRGAIPHLAERLGDYLELRGRLGGRE
jgi:8-oxo-dGTP diphosphatase